MLFDATVDGRTMRVEVRGRDGRYTVVIDGKPLEVDAHGTGAHFLSLILDGKSYEAGMEKRPTGYAVVLPDDVIAVDIAPAARGAAASFRKPAGPIRVTAPMPGKLVRLLVTRGQAVEAGQGLVVVEAMKMENELRAPRAGRVSELPVQEGQAVDTGTLLVRLE